MQSIFIVALTGTFSGMVLALQMVHSFKQFQAEGLVGGVVALSLTREISPVFTGIMVTARAGSALAAELGNMRVTEQIDAITTMGVSPVQYLLSPRLIAAVADGAAALRRSTRAWAWPAHGSSRWNGCTSTRASSSRAPSSTPSPRTFSWAKSRPCVFGFLIAAISCRQGFFASGGARGVGIATTRAVVQSAVAILVANYVLTSWLTPD